MFRIFLTMLTLCAGLSAVAQQSTLAPDQNPNYMLSQAKYTGQRDSLLSYANTTVQQTYKAYDWREARDERRAERRSFRRQLALTNAQYGSPYLNYDYGWNTYRYSYNPYGYYNRYGWGIRPSIGFRTGNWWFGF